MTVKGWLSARLVVKKLVGFMLVLSVGSLFAICGACAKQPQKGLNTYFKTIECMGSIRETLSILLAILKSRWYWIIVGVTSAIMITPFVIVMILISLPTPFNFLATFSVVIAWGIVAGYKDWIIAKAKEQKQKIQP